MLRAQVYVDQIHPDVHAITRHCPDKRKTVVLVARSAFYEPPSELQPTADKPQLRMHGIPPLTIPGKIEEIIFEAILIKKRAVVDFSRNPKYINGLESHECLLQEHVGPGKAKVTTYLVFQVFTNCTRKPNFAISLVTTGTELYKEVTFYKDFEQIIAVVSKLDQRGDRLIKALRWWSKTAESRGVKRTKTMAGGLGRNFEQEEKRTWFRVRPVLL